MNELDADVAAATLGMSFLPSEKVRSLRQQSGLRMSVSSDTSQSDRVFIKAALKNNTLLAQQQQTAAKEPAPVDGPSTNEEPKASTPSEPLTPMDELIRAAALMNPRQFELPREMSIFVQFPGTDRSIYCKLFVFEVMRNLRFLQLSQTVGNIVQRKFSAPTKRNRMN